MNHQATLSREGEKAWLRIKQHLEWCDHFGLGFIFSAHPLVVDIFRERLADIYRVRITRLLTSVPDQPEKLLTQLLPELLHPPQYRRSQKTPYWLDLSRQSGPGWPEARISFLLRINEQREALRQSLTRPLVLILPSDERSRIKELAPDLWAIRVFSLVTGNWTAGESAVAPPEFLQSIEEAPYLPSEQEASVIAEWERIKDNQPPNRGGLLAAQRAFAVCQNMQYLAQAEIISNWMATTARLIVARDLVNLEALRDLSVSLIKVGDTDKASGRFEDASKAYAESLDISRKIILRVGETPESLRDLSVSFDKVGDTDKALGRFEDAAKAYAEGLNISRKIILRFGETPEALRDLSISLDKVGNTDKALGRFEDASKAFHEGLSIGVFLTELFPDYQDFNGLADHFRHQIRSLNKDGSST